eukprot:gene11088-18700_t
MLAELTSRAQESAMGQAIIVISGTRKGDSKDRMKDLRYTIQSTRYNLKGPWGPTWLLQLLLVSS